MFRAYKYKLYPTEEQKVLIGKHIGACRFVYNLALETKNYAYSQHKKKLSCFDLIGQLPPLKEQCVWLKDVSNPSLQQAVIDLDKAFTMFFKGKTMFPVFKGRHSRRSFRSPDGNKIRIDGDKVIIPKFNEGIRFVQDRTFDGVIKQCTVSKTPTNKYFISILVEGGKQLPSKPQPEENNTIGIDLGLSHYIITSDGLKVDNPKHLKNSTKRLKCLQRRLSKKKKGSQNREKAKLKVALCHEQITNQRKDFLHKLSSKLISENQAICLEDLNIKGMVNNHKLARSISDAGWGMFVEMCKYKADWYGKTVLQIPTFEPSTKICSNCGYTNKALTLKDREWDCVCGVHHDRDINAAINIKNYCLRNSGKGIPVEPVELPTLVGALKQEVITVETTSVS